jgi:uncharacterized membrane protein HdeD (DUF308 family)
MTEANSMPIYPMAKTCKGLMGNPFSRLMLIVPGLVFIALGVLIVVEPKILVWLVAIFFVVIGLMRLFMASLFRKFRA